MKKISQSWKQQKQRHAPSPKCITSPKTHSTSSSMEGNKGLVGAGGVASHQRFLGRIPVGGGEPYGGLNKPTSTRMAAPFEKVAEKDEENSRNTESLKSVNHGTKSAHDHPRDSTFNSSFGDDDLFSAVDRMEQDFMEVKSDEEIQNPSRESSPKHVKLHSMSQRINIKRNPRMVDVGMKQSVTKPCIPPSLKPDCHDQGLKTAKDPVEDLTGFSGVEAGASMAKKLTKGGQGSHVQLDTSLDISITSLNSPLQVSTPVENRYVPKAKQNKRTAATGDVGNIEMGNITSLHPTKANKTSLFQNIMKSHSGSSAENNNGKDSGNDNLNAKNQERVDLDRQSKKSEINKENVGSHMSGSSKCPANNSERYSGKKTNKSSSRRSYKMGDASNQDMSPYNKPQDTKVTNSPFSDNQIQTSESIPPLQSDMPKKTEQSNTVVDAPHQVESGFTETGSQNVATEDFISGSHHVGGQDKSVVSVGGKLGSEERLHLASWGLPDVVLQRYSEKGITAMFEWQAECLCTGKVLDGKKVDKLMTTSARKWVDFT